MGISVKLNSQFDLEQQTRTLPTSPSSLSQHQQPIYSNQQQPPVISSPRTNYPPETTDGFDRNHSFSSRKSNASDTSMEFSRRMHQFVVRTFTTPMKCHHCTSLMVICLFLIIHTMFHYFLSFTDRSYTSRCCVRLLQFFVSCFMLPKSSYSLLDAR